MVDKFQNDGGCVSRGFEEGATIDRDKLVRVRLGDPDVATGVGEPLGVRVHAKLHLASAITLLVSCKLRQFIQNLCIVEVP